ncbi:MAG: prepilin-type N-terminal cleavage/methylation domain-containing protein [Lachnospiraceae bacterium]|nr:prepilin-type N-terminal cleavage/methylation domain-containing protein [Lachnospiraceae bacterium]
MRKIDNRGLSLAEILVVLAIMALVATVGIWGINAVSGRPAQQCAQRVIYSLERARVTATGRMNTYYKLYVDSATGKVMCEEGISNDTGASVVYNITTSEMGTARVRLSYVQADGTIKTMGRGESITYTFDPGSGGFKTYPSSKLIFMSGGREYKVKLVHLTGKVYLDLE